MSPPPFLCLSERSVQRRLCVELNDLERVKFLDSFQVGEGTSGKWLVQALLPRPFPNKKNICATNKLPEFCKVDRQKQVNVGQILCKLYGPVLLPKVTHPCDPFSARQVF